MNDKPLTDKQFHEAIGRLFMKIHLAESAQDVANALVDTPNGTVQEWGFAIAARCGYRAYYYAASIRVEKLDERVEAK